MSFEDAAFPNAAVPAVTLLPLLLLLPPASPCRESSRPNDPTSPSPVTLALALRFITEPRAPPLGVPMGRGAVAGGKPPLLPALEPPPPPPLALPRGSSRPTPAGRFPMTAAAESGPDMAENEWAESSVELSRLATR